MRIKYAVKVNYSRIKYADIIGITPKSIVDN